MSNFCSYLAATILAVAATAPAEATCVGSPAISSCFDGEGNQYTVNRLGNMTTVTGSNATTGSQWNETITRFGNTTSYQGQTNGRSWNMNETDSAGMRTYSGTNADGQTFFHTCTPYGGCN